MSKTNGVKITGNKEKTSTGKPMTKPQMKMKEKKLMLGSSRKGN